MIFAFSLFLSDLLVFFELIPFLSFAPFLLDHAARRSATPVQPSEADDEESSASSRPATVPARRSVPANAFALLAHDHDDDDDDDDEDENGND